MLDARKMELIRETGPGGYLLVRPLATDTGPDADAQAAAHVRGSHDLGLIVRLGQ